MKRCRIPVAITVLSLVCLPAAAPGAETDPSPEKYLDSAVSFADVVLEEGRDTYGKKSPLFVDGLHVKTREPVVWKGRGREDWVLSNLASQQPLLRLLDGLTGLTGEKKYRQAAEQAARYALKHVRAPSGLLYWGGHTAWDLRKDRPVGQYRPFIHEMKTHQPYYRIMWRVNPDATRKLLGRIWGGHILDWSRLDYNRHATIRSAGPPKWKHAFRKEIEVPFPARGNNLSFCNVTPPLMHSAVALAVLGEDRDALKWARRVIYRWQQARHPETGLSGGQLSYRRHDRAKAVLGHVHPSINEATFVGSYQQHSRYHKLPLAQMQAGEKLRNAGQPYAAVGEEFISWASEDLKTYARQCYDEDTGQFIAKLQDGSPIQWRKSKSGYFGPRSFAPRKPDGLVFWGYAMAYRLTHDPAHWRMLRQIGRVRDLGKFGNADGHGRALNERTGDNTARTIYALLEAHRATGDKAFLRLACRVADNIATGQTETGLFPDDNAEYARTGSENPLALLHLAGALAGKSDSLPQPMCDGRFFHCVYHGKLDKHQRKRRDRRTTDDRVFYRGR